jgi:hypothetical protein
MAVLLSYAIQLGYQENFEKSEVNICKISFYILRQECLVVAGPRFASPTIEFDELESFSHPKQKDEKPPLAPFTSEVLKDQFVDGILNALYGI